jgi:hypothetical protein
MTMTGLGVQKSVTVETSPERAFQVFTHRNLDRFGESEQEMRAGFESPGGWQGLLEEFAKAV